MSNHQNHHPPKTRLLLGGGDPELGVVTMQIQGVPLSGQVFPFYTKNKKGKVDLKIDKVYQIG